MADMTKITQRHILPTNDDGSVDWLDLRHIVRGHVYMHPQKPADFNLDWDEEVLPVLKDLFAYGYDLGAQEQLHIDNQYLKQRLKEQDDALVKAKDVLDGLMCLGCKKQGAELADGCCRDADCDAGFYGINADEVKAALDAIAATSQGSDTDG